MSRFGKRYSGFDRFQQRHRSIGFPLAVLQKYADDQGGYHAATIAYYGFFSIFPLLLVLTTVLGFILESHPHLEQRIVDSALGQFPVIGSVANDGPLRTTIRLTSSPLLSRPTVAGRGQPRLSRSRRRRDV